MLTHAIQSDIVMICARVTHEKKIRKGFLSFIHNVTKFRCSSPGNDILETYCKYFCGIKSFA